MQDGIMKYWLKSSYLNGNREYIESIYESYLQNKLSVSEKWREIFENMEQNDSSYNVQSSINTITNSHNPTETTISDSKQIKQIKIIELIEAYRMQGHKIAKTDPLELVKKKIDPELTAEFYGLQEENMDEMFHVDNLCNLNKELPLKEIMKLLQNIYSKNIGVEYMHVETSEERQWIQEEIEKNQGKIFTSKEKSIKVLKELTAAEDLEKFIAVKFPGAKRFSLEGGDTLIPLLKEIIDIAAQDGITETILGMAHRGRLNVLINVLGKKSQALFDEFTGKSNDKLGSGDVKYHLGYSSDMQTKAGKIHLTLAFNPSHLEIVNPVVIGSVKARLDRQQAGNDHILPVTIHGDSAIAGQGVVQETFNMSQARGFAVGGSIRIVVNNQVGFTTSNPRDTRSTMYCTDVAKMINAPIFHVNSDKPDAVLHVANIAMKYRKKFKKDVIIDLVCYRKHGHNESDDPRATQPLMYQVIKKHPTTKELYTQELVSKNYIMSTEADNISNNYRGILEQGERANPEWRASEKVNLWKKYTENKNQNEIANISIEKLKHIGDKICSMPSSTQLHSRVKKVYENRRKMLNEELSVDWGFAENLAYASILTDGYDVRLVGQDSGRGTFFHRHAVLHDQNTAETYIPLEKIESNQGKISIYDSVLSEASVLAFEYGYATANPNCLAIWEAQFGDFANGAQVVIDQFLSSGEQKWGRLCGLTMLLPHGYEGQGPEHSSARLERYLQLCADDNMIVCIPSTPAQIYHLLRRQIHSNYRKPLIVMSPKSLLRHPEAISKMEELTKEGFKLIIDDNRNTDKRAITRLVLCSGKVYYELIKEVLEQKLEHIAVVRVEQLYPFPKQELKTTLEKYQNAKDIIWCQEEPKNQGAWYCNKHRFENIKPKNVKLTYAGREESASPAAGYSELHRKQQNKLIGDALGISIPTQ